MDPIPAILVTGAAGAAKTTFIRALAAHPSGGRLAVLDNDGGDLVQALAGIPAEVAVLTACMCCTGQVALQTRLVQLIRQAHPQRLIVAASAAADPAALQRALQEEHLARALRVIHHACVASAAQLTAAPPAARELWLQQLRAADYAVAADGPAAEALRATLATMGLADKRIVPAANAVHGAMSATEAAA